MVHYRFPPLLVRSSRMRRRARLRGRRRRRRLPSFRGDLRSGTGRDPWRKAELILLLLLLLIAELLELADFRQLHRDGLVGLWPFWSGLVLSPDVGPEKGEYKKSISLKNSMMTR